MCGADQWSPERESKSYNPVQVTSTQFFRETSLGRCVVSLEFTPPDELFAAGEIRKPYSLEYSLAYALPAGGSKLVVPVQKLLNRIDDLVPASLGQFEPIGQSKKVSGGGQAFEWHLPDITLKDASGRILVSRVAPAVVKSTTCKYVTVAGAEAEFLTGDPGNRGKLSLVLPLKALGSQTPALQPKGSCGIDIEVQLPIHNTSAKVDSVVTVGMSVVVGDFVVVEQAAASAVPVAQ
jgi:hypothetical protein